jgi:hypothetical protein
VQQNAIPQSRRQNAGNIFHPKAFGFEREREREEVLLDVAQEENRKREDEKSRLQCF